MFDIRACRGCLSTKGRLEKMSDMTKKLYAAVTGLEINSIDGLPTYFCVECHVHMKKILSFRRRCRRAFYVMKEIISVDNQLTQNNILTLNRKKTNLQYPYSYNKCRNTSYFTMDTLEPDVETLIATLDEPGKITVDLVKQDIDTRSTVFHIDIEPALTISTPDPDTEIAQIENIDIEDTIIDEPEPMDIEEPFPEDPPKENVTDQSDSDDANNTIEGKIFRKKKKPMLSKKVIECCSILAEARIRVLTLQEQKEAFQFRMEEEPFKSAKYKCALCIMILDNMENLLKHIETHNKCKKYSFICKVCKVKFQKEDHLASHNSVAHLYEYKCKRCDAPPLHTLNSIIAHHKENHPREEEAKETTSRMLKIKDYFDLTPCTQKEMTMKRFLPTSEHECTECGMNFVYPNLLYAHIYKHAYPKNVDIKSALQCDICGIYYKVATSLNYHMQIMHLYTYQCKKCPTIAYNIQEAEHHLGTHEPMQYLCEFCDKQLRTERELRTHRHNEHYTKTHTYHCNLCGVSHTSEELLYQHQVTMHETISVNNPLTVNEEYFCRPCDFQFVSLNAYKMHAINHQHEGVKSFENVCIPCKKVFNTPEELKTHNYTSCKKLNKYPVKCPYCDDIMYSGKQYLVHQKREHPNEKYRPINEAKLCEQCGQSVTDIKDHMKRHNAPGELFTGDHRDYECALCYPVRKVTGARRYASHVVRVHASRPYSCTLCAATFRWCSECRDHILKTHSPVLPYKCEICSKEFSHGEFLEEHSLNVHKNLIKVPRPDPKNTMTLWVYPHMKLNLSLLDHSVLDIITVELWDYLHEKREVLEDFRNYVVLDKPEVGPRKKKAKKSKKKKKDKVVKVTEVVECLDNLEIIEQDGEKFVNINGILYKVQMDQLGNS